MAAPVSDDEFEAALAAPPKPAKGPRAKVTDEEFEAALLAPPTPASPTAPTRSPNVSLRGLTTTGLTNAGTDLAQTSRSVALQSGASPERADQAYRDAILTARVVGDEADAEEVRETLAATDPLDRALGRRVMPAPLAEPTKAKRDTDYREMVDTVDLTTAIKGQEAAPVAMPESHQKAWLQKAKAGAARTAAGMISGGILPVVDLVRQQLGEASWFEGAADTPAETLAILKAAGDDPQVQRLGAMAAGMVPGVMTAIGKGDIAERGGEDLARLATGALASTPLPAIGGNIAKATGLDDGETLLWWDDANARPEFDAAAAAFYESGDRSEVDALPVRAMPARLRGGEIDIDTFLRAAEQDPDLASVAEARNLAPEAIEAAIQQLPVSVASRYQPDILPSTEEITDAIRRRHRAKDWSGADLLTELEPLVAAGFLRPVDNGKDPLFVPSRFQEALRYMGVPWAAVVVEPDIPLFPLLDNDVQPGDTSVMAKLRAARVPSVYGAESMARSGAYDDWLEAMGLRGGDHYATLARPESSWYARTLADLALPDYGMRGWADVYKRAGGDPTSATAKTLGTADVLSQFVIPAESIAIAPMGAALRAGAKTRSVAKAFRELGVAKAPIVRAAVSSDPLDVVGATMKEELLEQVASGRFNPDDMTATARRQISDLAVASGVPDPEAFVGDVLDALRDRRAAIFDVNGEIAVKGGPVTEALRISRPYQDTATQLEVLMTPAERDVFMRVQEVLALNAAEAGEIKTPAEWFERQMWTRGGADEALPEGTLYSGDSPVVEIEAPVTNPQGFFSALRRAVESLKGDRFTSDQLRATLRNTPGVKADEIEWTGLDTFLAENPKTTKADVLEWLDGHSVVVEERVLGDAAADEAFNAHNAHIGKMEEWYDTGRGAEWAAESTRLHAALVSAGRPGYVNYQLPGGTNYREVLFKLPVDLRTGGGWQDFRNAMHNAGVSASDADEARRWAFGVSPVHIDMEAVERARAKMGDAFMARYREVLLDGPRDVREVKFRAPHFDGVDAENLLAHARISDRIGPNGEKILHVEEVQSDAARAYRDAQIAIVETVERDFDGLVERMKRSGVLEVICDH